MSFYAELSCQHGHRHETASCDKSDCKLCNMELRECDVAKFVRHNRADCQWSVADPQNAKHIEAAISAMFKAHSIAGDHDQFVELVRRTAGSDQFDRLIRRRGLL